MVQDDSQIKQRGDVRGIGANPGLLIDSYEMKGSDGYLVYDDAFDTRAEIGFIGGEAVRADGPGKKIIETNWLSAGVIRDTMLMLISYETTTTGEGDAIAGGERLLEGRILKRNPKTKEIEKTFNIGYTHNYLINKNPGNQPKAMHVDSYATHYLNFTPQHEYKMELETALTIEPHQSVIIDYIFFEYMATASWVEPTTRAYVGESADDLGGIPAVPQLEGYLWAISLNGSGDGTANIYPYTYATLYTSYQLYNYFYGTYNDIKYVNICPTDHSGPTGLSVDWTALGTMAGGYYITISIDTGFGGGTLYGTGLILGSKAAEQV